MVQTPHPPGRKVHCEGGYEAFIPAPLPPRIQWVPELVCALSEADRSIGRLAGEGGRLPNPHVLIRPFVRKEAVLSSRIEGTQATLGELLASEAGAAVDRSPDDLHEVGNYVIALELGSRRLKRSPLSLALVQALHGRLMSGVRGGEATPGRFRRTQNWIGAPGCTPRTASYVPPPPAQLSRCLREWESFLEDRSLPPLAHVALLHYQFEAIHPFLDGNGRVGRLLVILALIQRGILPAPLLYLSAYFEADRIAYYAHLSAVTERGAWEAWLEYFLRGVARQAEDARLRAERINEVRLGWRRKLEGLASKVLFEVVEGLASNPYLMVKKTAERLRVAFSTVQRGVDRLVKAGILSQVGEARRDRVYCAKELLTILEAPSPRESRSGRARAHRP
jgi:Fic family protein